MLIACFLPYIVKTFCESVLLQQHQIFFFFGCSGISISRLLSTPHQSLTKWGIDRILVFCYSLFFSFLLLLKKAPQNK